MRALTFSPAVQAFFDALIRAAETGSAIPAPPSDDAAYTPAERAFLRTELLPFHAQLTAGR